MCNSYTSRGSRQCRRNKVGCPSRNENLHWRCRTNMRVELVRKSTLASCRSSRVTCTTPTYGSERFRGERVPYLTDLNKVHSTQIPKTLFRASTVVVQFETALMVVTVYRIRVKLTIPRSSDGKITSRLSKLHLL